jgi:hypothetical protein
VQKEYDRVSNTTAARVDKLKANIGVLAIEFGEALLPHIDKVVNFLTSPEGQEWGRGAVEKAAAAVTSLASAIQFIVTLFSNLSETIGGTGVAVVALGVAIAGLTGPLGLAMAAGVAMGAAIAEGIDRVIHGAERAQLALLQLHNKAQAIRNQEAQGQVNEVQSELDAGNAANARDRRAQTRRHWRCTVGRTR